MIEIALSKGRIADSFIDILYRKKLIMEKPNIARELIFQYPNMKIMIARSSDLSKILDNKNANLAVLGSDVIEEKLEEKYIELMDLGIGKCTFALAALPNINLENIKSSATKYPNLAKKYLKELKLQCEIKKMDGCLELFPNIGFSDGIIDLVETGSTLKANGLVILKTFESISTRVITTKENENNEEIKKLIYKIK